MKAAGFVLTGGSSTRMGQDKALLPVGDVTLCEYVAKVVESVAGHVLLVGHPERYGQLNYPCVADLRPGFGPMSGLETALSLGLSELNLIASCDIYPLKPEWLHALLWEAERGAICAIAEDADGNVQPLCGIYHSECLPFIERALSAGRLRMFDLLDELQAVRVKLDGPVLNLNTPEQYRGICE